MSHFNCEHCGTTCIDSAHGYVTGCEHHPPDIVEDGFGSHWRNHCHNCKQHGVIEVVRPGKVQCRNCG